MFLQMRMAYELCLATAGKQVPIRTDWIHEVKHDGHRMLVIRENERVWPLSRNGTDWTKRYSWIAEAALKNRQKHFVIDGEAAILSGNPRQSGAYGKEQACKTPDAK